jgi:signal transduction histidine kinase
MLNSEDQAAGIVLLCDAQGAILRVIRDDLGMADRVVPGQPWTLLADRGNFWKALDFLVELQNQGAAYDWELNVPIANQVITLHLTGVVVDEQLWIVGARTRDGVLQLCEELMHIDGKEMRALRTAVKEQTRLVRAQVEGDRALYDDIARLNNELVNLQRELAQKNAELERLNKQAQEAAALAERARLARELHDSVTQALYSVNLYADATRLALLSGKGDVAAENVHQLRNLAREAMSDMRLLIFELRPSILEEAGLVGALQARLEAVEVRSGFRTAFQVEGERCLPPSVEAELYRVTQEALNNVLKHAQAKQVTVHLQFDEARLCLTIQDDGLGFDLETARQSGGLGLRSMEERVQHIGGNLILVTAPGKGTTLRIEVDA